jgi:hypothetical protein
MNKKFFEKYKTLGYNGGYWATFCVVSDGEITVESDWREAEKILNPEWTVYQCYNPEICVEDYMEKQRRADELRSRLFELESEQLTLKKLLASKLPIDQPVLFGDIVAVRDEDGVVVFKKAILPNQIQSKQDER